MWSEERLKKPTKNNVAHFVLCCIEGKVHLPPFRQTPVFLDGLLDYRGGKRSRTFRDNIRVYNAMFQFTSIGGKIDEDVNRRPGPYVFRICGQNYHRIGSLLPVDGQQPCFAQFYIHDTENEVSNRMRPFSSSRGQSEIDSSVVSGLIAMLDDTNVVVQAFRMARDRFQEVDFVPVRLKLFGDRFYRRYGEATSSEIAGLIVGDFDNLINHRDVVVEHKSVGLQRITDLHPSFMSMQYPLLFPYGDDGFHLGIKYQSSVTRAETKRGSVTPREFYSYTIQQRLSEGQTLVRGGKLFHQYLVDAFTSIEGMRLDYIKHNQEKLRSEVYGGIVDAVHRGDRDASDVGKRIILPSSFTSGPRYLMQNYQDAMAICRNYGYLELFITMTCNPKWPEITEALKYIDGQRAEDRPDIIARVFKIRLKLFMEDLVKNKYFGNVTAGNYLSSISTFDFLYAAHIFM